MLVAHVAVYVQLAKTAGLVAINSRVIQRAISTIAEVSETLV